MKNIEGNYEPTPEVYKCKNCGEEINLTEHNINGGYCTDCYEEVLGDFGDENTNGTF